MGHSIKDFLKKPSLLFFTLGHNGLLNWMSDEIYLKIAFRIRMKKKLNLNNPSTFSEKLQWLKINFRNPKFTLLADKYEVKKYVSDKIGEQYIIPTLGVWEHFDDIDFEKLPNQFVLKCTHDSGGIIICKNKKEFNKKKAKKQIEKCLKKNFFYAYREWPYKNIKPRIIAEPYLEDSKTSELRDYKFFTFGGKVKALYIATDRGSNDETKFDFYDEEFNHLDFTNGHPNSNIKLDKPQQFDLMKELAGKLSEELPQIRVDFYEMNGQVLFGELTFFHMCGMTPFCPEKWDYLFGSWLDLSKIK